MGLDVEPYNSGSILVPVKARTKPNIIAKKNPCKKVVSPNESNKTENPSPTLNPDIIHNENKYLKQHIPDTKHSNSNQTDNKQKTELTKKSSTSDDLYNCPILMSIMRDPMVANCGHTFDKMAIDIWMRSSNACPVCKIGITGVSPNYALRAIIIEKFKDRVLWPEAS